MQEREFNKAFYINFIIWAAITGSVFVYILVAKSAPVGGSIDIGDELGVLRYVLVAVSMVIFFVTMLVRKLFNSGVFDKGSAKNSLGAYTVHKIIIYALNESVAIYGLVLYFMSGSDYDLYGFCILSLVYQVIAMPRYETLKDWALKRRLLERGAPGYADGRGYRK